MSESYTFFSQDVSACNETEAWWNMINCIVNFVSASTNLATNLESNHISNVRGGNKLPEKLPIQEDVAPLTDNSDQNKEIEALPKKPEDMCLSDFPCFVDEIAEKSKDITLEKPSSDTNTPADSVTTPPEDPLSKLLEETPTESPESPPSADVKNPQEKGDYDKLKCMLPLAAEPQPMQESDEGIDLQNDVPTPNEDTESKTKKPASEEPAEDGNLKTPSDDSCFFQEYSDSDPSIDFSDIGSALDDVTIDTDKTVTQNTVTNPNQTEESTKQDNIERFNKEENQKQIEEIRQILLSEGIISRRFQEPDEKESKSKDTLDVRKSREIQTNATSRFKRTVRALITQSPELQKPIKDDITIKKAKERSQDANTSKAVPKNLNELKEQLDSIKIRPHTAGPQPKKETTPEKQMADLTKRLKCCHTKNLSGKKGSTGEEHLRAPRSSVINVKKDIIAEKTTKGNAPRKHLKVTTRYDSIESVVKRMIQGLPKSTEQPAEKEAQRLSNDKQGTSKKQKKPNNLINQQSKDESPSMSTRQSNRNRSSSRSSASSRIFPQKDLKKERPTEAPIIYLNKKSINVFKNEGEINPPEESGRSRPAIKTIKKLKVTTEEKRKQKNTNQASEEKKQLSATKTPANKPKSRPRSAT